MLREQLVRDPSDREARSLLARVLAWNRRFVESTVEYERLLADHPDDAFDRAGYARVLTWSGQIEQSLGEFRRAIAADSTNLEVRLDYARALSWTGDLPGASMEYRRILGVNPSQGDAWLGYATVARWRSGATASDRFLTRAEANGAEPKAAGEERNAVRRASGPSLGGGWESARERQYVEGPDFTIESAGPYASGRVTIGRTADVTIRTAWLAQFERGDGGVLSYDLDTRLVRADLAFLRSYPFQVAGGVESRLLQPGVAGVTYPLLGVGDFVGWNARAWWFLGRFTPSAGARRGFLPIKSTSGPNEILVGHQTRLEATLAWQWSGRGSATAGIERGGYSDGNVRGTVRGGTAYRIRVRNPVAALDYAFAFNDFDRTSASYFTPLRGVLQAAGLGISGYRDRSALSYGVRYQFSSLASDNFGGIRTSAWTVYLNGTALGSIGLGLDGSYSRDNNAYEIWSIGLHAAARW